jgi:hypothetical protein
MSGKLQYVPPVPIQLHDEDTTHKETWASDVHIGDCTVVTGSNGSQFAVWTISIHTTAGGTIKLLKRYSEMDSLRRDLVRTFPDHVSEIPRLPPKKVIGNLNNKFLMQRRRGLEYFVNCVLLNPDLGNSEIVRKFVGNA